MNGGPSGFHNAPATRTLVIACGILSVLSGAMGRLPSLGLSYEDVFKNFRVWRLIVSAFAFSSTPELMFGLYLLFYFRIFERQMGSNKYSVFVLFSVFSSTMFEILSLALFRDSRRKVLASGPYNLVFSLFVPFYFDIPVSTRYRIFGINFSDKSLVYLAGAQLLLSSWKKSLLPGVCGILSGVMYHLNIFHVRKQKFPNFLITLSSRFAWPSFGGSPSSTVTGNFVDTGHHVARQLEVPRNYPRFASTATLAQPSEDSVSTLMAMGFDRTLATQALLQAGNDINAATNILLETHS